MFNRALGFNRVEGFRAGYRALGFIGLRGLGLWGFGVLRVEGCGFGMRVWTLGRK